MLISFPRQIGSQIYVLKDALICRARYNAWIINIVIDTADKVSAQYVELHTHICSGPCHRSEVLYPNTCPQRAEGVTQGRVAKQARGFEICCGEALTEVHMTLQRQLYNLVHVVTTP